MASLEHLAWAWSWSWTWLTNIDASVYISLKTGRRIPRAGFSIFFFCFFIFTLGIGSFTTCPLFFSNKNLSAAQQIIISSLHTMSFVAFSCTMGNWWGNPCISYMMKYTIRWESNGRKAPILWEKYGYQFPRLSRYHRIFCIFPYCGKFMGKPMHFPYDEVHHRMGIRWEICTHTMGKVWVSVFQTFPIPWVLLHFSVLWEIYGETHTFPICWSIP